jgi:nitrite reductase (NADH) large subunit
MSEPIVIIGQGMAATKLVEELSQRALGRYALIVIGAERRRAYNRVLLSSLLAREVVADEIELKPAHWWAKNGVTNLYGRPVTAVDRAAHRVTLANGVQIAYSKLVFATGSDPILLAKPGMDLPGVLTFRAMEDVDAMLREAKPGRPVVVIGGGLLGLEAAYGLAKAGADVTLVNITSRLMDRQLDGPAAALLRRAIEAKGCKVLLEADTMRVRGTTRAEAIELADGRVLPADLVVCAIGVRPNARLAKASGLHCNRGILVDDQMRSLDPDVFAIGECAEHRGIAYGLVEPAYEHARVLARILAGDDKARYEGSILATNLKVSGVALFSAGDFLGENKETLVFEDERAQVYKKIVIEDDRVTGAVLYGDTADGLWYLDLMRSATPVAAMRDDLIFGRTLAMKEAEAIAA